ncbi:MAG: outer membrane protein assembly factor BamD [Nitrospirae bacterium]|nr:outer membrane protein assembly factor BamD [Nitrospirota bacterium]
MKTIQKHKRLLFLFLAVSILLSACGGKKEVAPVFNPDASFKQAAEKAKEGYYEEARKILEEVKAQDASGKYSPLAQIRIGDMYFEEGSYEEAAAEYERFLDIHSYHRYAYYAQYQLAMCYYRRIDTIDVSYGWARQALTEFEKLQTTYPRNPYMNVTESRIKECRNILAGFEFYVGEFYFKKESFNAAVLRFNQVLQKYPDSKKESDALYYLALSYKNLGDKDKAIEALNMLLDKHPTTRQADAAKKLMTTLK